jgi:guanosine-3',5'-bis(diphosphate) 3'-pyrophosphohydrolase
MAHDLTRLLQAASFAADRHRDQHRKDAAESPYINHPLAVAELLADVGGMTDIDLLAAALLHDTVEDTTTSLDEISRQFGDEVRQLVAEVTDNKSLPKMRRKELQIENAPHKSARAKQLKIADKICNVRDLDADSPVGWDRDRKAHYLDWAVNVVAGCRGVNPGLERLFDDSITKARQRLGI